MPVTIVVRNVFSKVMGDLNDSVKFRLKSELSYRIKGAFFKIDWDDPDNDWDGTVDLFFPKKGNSFYTGMISNVRSILDECGIPFTIEDRRLKSLTNFPELDFVRGAKEDRRYQNFTVERCLKATRGVIQVATGGGKTTIVAKIIAGAKCHPFLFFVLSRDLLYQAKEDLEGCLNTTVGMVGDGNIDIQKVTVVMVQTAVKAVRRDDAKAADALDAFKYDEEDKDWDDKTADADDDAKRICGLLRAAQGVYLDECHHAAARTVQLVLESTPNAYWRFGGSATPFREDGADKMIQALFARTLVEISPSWLIRNGYLVKPYIFNINMKNPVTEMLRYGTIYKEKISENQMLHDLVANIATRLESCDIPYLILVQRYSHGDAVRLLKPDIPFIKGAQMTRRQRREAIDALRDGGVKGAIATTLADEGLDVRCLGSVLVAGGGKSITRVYQRVGRALRPFPNKKRAIIFLFHHQCKYLHAHGQRVRSMLKEEPEFVVIDTDIDRAMTALDDLICPSGSLFDD